ncbi:Growth_factor receptor cysteine-rich domain superfamily [Hexamita inflata]|uniref:Growth factor receptor cysteine-rich domain superfamily n=1 Tax=Hexamita inflata TaxID=28002 RepID=A0AA86UVG0_9EUKA|nr:Growth factor receptor cysteine-rich domain superfamily [Hexamita inflata]
MCVQLAGYGIVDWIDCKKCEDGQNVVGNKCQTCPLGTVYNIQNKQCICDELNGFAGPDQDHCQECSTVNAIVHQGACQPCGTGTKLVNKVCECDESIGYVASNLNQCEYCWGASEIIINGECQSCDNQDINSRYDSINKNCICKPHFKMITNICEQDRKNMMLTIAIVIPIACVVVLFVVLLIIYLKKQEIKQTQQENKAPEQVIPEQTITDQVTLPQI